MSQEILDDAKLCTLEVTCGTWFNNKRIRNIASGVDLGDGVNVAQLSTNLGPIISDINALLGAGPGLIGTWAQFPAITNINVNSNNIYSTVNQTFINGPSSITLNYQTINSFAYTSTAFSTLASYVAVDSCLLMQHKSTLSTLVPTVNYLSSAFSTLAAYAAVDACMTVTNKNNISTLTGDLPARRQVGFSTVALSATPNQIVGTNISTLGWVTAFNTGGNVQLDLDSLNVWPKQQFDCMRFANIGNSGVVNLYLNTIAETNSWLGTINPGESFSYVYNGPIPPASTDIVLSTNYVRFTGV